MEEQNNQKYWVIINGIRKGPLTLDELVRLAPAPATPVWRQGLEDWCAVSSLPELDGCSNATVPPVPAVPPVYVRQPVQPQFSNTVNSYNGISNTPRPEQPAEAMPPTYLAWSIVVMLICCLVPGIVALIYSTKVSSRFSIGDYAGARDASENAAMWIIVTVVCGIIAVPFQILLAFV